jgi:hypothetical protein
MKSILTLSVLTALLLGASSQCFAFSMRLDIHSLKECPDGLTIRSKLSDGMIVFDVEVDPEEVARAGELYKGRVAANALLDVAVPGQKIASTTLHGETKGRSTRYQFRISPVAAKTSELNLGVSLHEKNGMVTVGGGVSMKIQLGGFEPKTETGPKQK